MKSSAVLLVLLTGLASARAQVYSVNARNFSATQLRLPTGMITEYGIFEQTAPSKKISAEGSAAGFVSQGGYSLRATGTNVAMTQGISFGYNFRLTNVLNSSPLQLMHLIRHPPMTKPDGTVFTAQSSKHTVTTTNGVVDGKLWYTLREPFELVPGLWELSVLDGHRVIVSQHFTVSATNEPLTTKGKLK